MSIKRLKVVFRCQMDVKTMSVYKPLFIITHIQITIWLPLLLLMLISTSCLLQ